MEEKLALEVFPLLVWRTILSNITHPKDIQACRQVCYCFGVELWKQNRAFFTIPNVLGHILKHFDGKELVSGVFALRQTCRLWKGAVDRSFLPFVSDGVLDSLPRLYNFNANAKLQRFQEETTEEDPRPLLFGKVRFSDRDLQPSDPLKFWWLAYDFFQRFSRHMSYVELECFQDHRMTLFLGPVAWKETLKVVLTKCLPKLGNTRQLTLRLFGHLHEENTLRLALESCDPLPKVPQLSRLTIGNVHGSLVNKLTEIAESRKLVTLKVANPCRCVHYLKGLRYFRVNRFKNLKELILEPYVHTLGDLKAIARIRNAQMSHLEFSVSLSNGSVAVEEGEAASTGITVDQLLDHLNTAKWRDSLRSLKLNLTTSNDARVTWRTDQLLPFPSLTKFALHFDHRVEFESLRVLSQLQSVRYVNVHIDESHNRPSTFFALSDGKPSLEGMEEILDFGKTWTDLQQLEVMTLIFIRRCVVITETVPASLLTSTTRLSYQRLRPEDGTNGSRGMLTFLGTFDQGRDDLTRTAKTFI